MPVLAGAYSPMVERLVQAGEPRVAYNTFIDLLDVPVEANEAKSAYAAMQAAPNIVSLIESLDTWAEKPLDRAYDPKDSVWRLGILADFGMRRDDERIAGIAERVFAAQAADARLLARRLRAYEAGMLALMSASLMQ